MNIFNQQLHITTLKTSHKQAVEKDKSFNLNMLILHKS
jgi:hypothetical protein